MILQKLAEAMRRQDWFTVLLEILIVVIGIFIGLQVDDWNEGRKDRSRESAYLSSLAKDIRSDVAEIDEIVRVSTLRMSALDWLISEATNRPLPDGFESARGRIEIESVPPYEIDSPYTIGIAMFILSTLDGNRSTYDTIVSTGGIGMIRDAALVRRIQDYYARVDKFRHFEVSLEGNRDKLIIAEQQAGLSPVDQTPPKELARLFRESPQLTAAAKNYWLFANRHLKLLYELRREANDLALLIESR